MKPLSQHLFLVGPAGVGKSTVGKQVALKLQCEFYDIDRIIEQRTGVGIAHIFDVEGEIGFRQREQTVLAEYAEKPAAIIATGAGAVLTPANCELIKATGDTIYLWAPEDILVSRVERNNHHRPLLQVNNVSQTVAQMLSERTPIYESLATWKVNAYDRKITYIANEICKLLSPSL